MKKVFCALLILVLILASVPALAAADIPAGLSGANQEEWEVLRLTNIERAQAGLPLLVTFSSLQQAAGVRSGELARQFDHIRPSGENPFTALEEQGISFYQAGENIALGYETPGEVVAAWMDSPSHRDNILTASLRYLGAGYTYDGAHLWAQLFVTGSGSDCVAISLNEEEAYFTLELKNGLIAYAPYDPLSSPTENGRISFNYPGAQPVQAGGGEPQQPQQPPALHPFLDVPAGSYYEDAVVWAVAEGVTTGTSATTFSPFATCTRGQVATFLWRAQGSPAPLSLDNPFIDVRPGDYFYEPVLWAVENNITNGTSATNFSPEQTCTSGQVVTFLWRANACPQPLIYGALAATYPGQYYTEAIAWADSVGLLFGPDKAFAPGNPSPRADIVTYLYRNAYN